MGHEPDLFAEMDTAADMLRETATLPVRSDDYQIEFRQIQKRRMPDLSREQWLDLFAEWREHYAGKLEIEMTKLRKRKAEDACERLRWSPSATSAIPPPTGSFASVVR